MQDTLLRLIEQVKQIKADPEDGLYEIFASSLQLLEFLSKASGSVGFQIPISVLLGNPSIRDLAERISNLAGTAPLTNAIGACLSNLIVPSPSAITLFLMPGGGGNPLVFHKLAGILQPSCKCVAVCPDPLSVDLYGAYNMQTLAADYVKLIRERQPEGPYFLLGYCFGGLVAYEIACQLAGNGTSVHSLILIEPSKPLLPKTNSGPAGNGRGRSKFSRAVTLIRRAQFRAFCNGIKNTLAPARRLMQKKWLRLRRGVRPLARKELERLIMLHEHELYSRYRPGKYSGEIALLWSERDPVWAGRSGGARLYDAEAAVDAWGALTSGPVKISQFPGDHDSVLDESCSALAEAITEIIKSDTKSR
jgi:thioesterase domain-containing protein